MPNYLYLVPSPIGNLSEVSPRIKEVLSSVDFIACEDTRNTSKLLNLLGISKPTLSCHEHNELSESVKIIKRILNGENCAYLSDAGFPCISDPGFLLTKECIENGIKVIPLSGPNAALLALIGSGLDTIHFMFYGFLDAKISKKETEIAGFLDFPYTIILYEAPHRINETLQSLYNILGNRKVCVARELTKMYEEFIRSDLKTLTETKREYKGELVIVLEGNKNVKVDSEIDQEILDKASLLIKEGYSKKETSQILTLLYKVNKNKLYKELIKND